MGKYMKKSKGAVGVAAVTDMTFGVCTRAKALALQRPPYHLRSRRHLRSSPPKKRSKSCNPNPNANINLAHNQCKSNRSRCRSAIINVKYSLKAGENNRSSFSTLVKYLSQDGGTADAEQQDENRMQEGSEGDRNESISCGENTPEINSRDRLERESTPCNLVRGLESIQAPGSATKPASSADIHRTRHRRRCLPSPDEVEEFFEDAEREQLQEFINKYNFDPVNEKPLPGRFEWEKV